MIEEKTFMHYDNSKNVNLDTFNYIMDTVNKQCDLYNKEKETKKKSLMNKYKKKLKRINKNHLNFKKSIKYYIHNKGDRKCEIE